MIRENTTRLAHQSHVPCAGVSSTRCTCLNNRTTPRSWKRQSRPFRPRAKKRYYNRIRVGSGSSAGDPYIQPGFGLILPKTPNLALELQYIPHREHLSSPSSEGDRWAAEPPYVTRLRGKVLLVSLRRRSTPSRGHRTQHRQLRQMLDRGDKKIGRWPQ